MSNRKMKEIKISDDDFFGEDLSYDQNFLEKIEEKIEQEIPGSEILSEIHCVLRYQ